MTDMSSTAKTRLIHLLGLPGQRISYEQARDLLDHPDPAVRRDLAGRTDLEPEILFYLARDPDPAVRRRIALNPQTPEQASVLLAKDFDDDVRCDLAERVGRIVPDLTPDEKSKAWRAVHQALTLLARDQLPRVRRALSQALHTLPDAPHDVVLMLAYDPESSVACPVLEFSPVLTDEDLLAVIQASPMTSSLVAISRRLNVGEEVSNALVGTGHVEAIAALLRNDSAQIREETLDAIIDAAAPQSSWHEPLVDRHGLSNKAALRIAEFVAASLLQKLAARRDLDAATIDTVSHMVRTRLRREEGEPVPTVALFDAETLRLAQRQVESLAAAGKLAERYLLHVAGEKTVPLIATALAHLGKVSLGAVIEVINAASAKGMLAVCWAADLSAEAAVQLQIKIARVPPDEVIKPRRGGGFDATEAELEWQLEMFTDLARKR
ncbi:MAG: DUF2336 domain-containing protein [Rhodospirillaceae bacterium]|nr:MAG: DUF2336 domain-containing protein [Rhodospirillaceae bacterium]